MRVFSVPKTEDKFKRPSMVLRAKKLRNIENWREGLQRRTRELGSERISSEK